VARVLDAIDAERRRDAHLATEKEALAALAEQRKREAAELNAEIERQRQRAAASEETARRATETLAALGGEGRAAASGSGSSWLTWAAVAGWTAFLGAALLLFQRWMADRREANTIAARGASSRAAADAAPTHVIE
jgi:beta-phosphoglucomutase-like phosphatase (HAD superfamily)